MQMLWHEAGQCWEEDMALKWSSEGLDDITESPSAPTPLLPHLLPPKVINQLYPLSQLSWVFWNSERKASQLMHLLRENALLPLGIRGCEITDKGSIEFFRYRP
jgi:hypothetical protein